jgi:uncharacterized membrane protein YdbT with pleckstrin-like domain
LSFVERHLIAGETVQYETRLHWIVMFQHILGAALLDLFAVALLVFSFRSRHTPGATSAILFWVAIVALLASGVAVASGALKRSATEMALTNKRVIVKTGIATRRTIELMLTRIESIVVEEPTLGRMLGFGTVIIRGTGGTPEVFERIAHPLEFRERVQSQIAAPATQS